MIIQFAINTMKDLLTIIIKNKEAADQDLPKINLSLRWLQL